MGERRRLGVQDALWLEMDRPTNLMVVDTVVWTEKPVDWLGVAYNTSFDIEEGRTLAQSVGLVLREPWWHPPAGRPSFQSPSSIGSSATRSQLQPESALKSDLTRAAR